MESLGWPVVGSSTTAAVVMVAWLWCGEPSSDRNTPSVSIVRVSLRNWQPPIRTVHGTLTLSRYAQLKHLKPAVRNMGTPCSITVRVALKCAHSLLFKVLKNLTKGQQIEFLIIKPTTCTNFSNLFLEWNSTCFGQFLCSSSGVLHCTYSSGICHTGLLTACCQQTCMTYTTAVCTVKNSWWWTEELSETCGVSFQE